VTTGPRVVLVAMPLMARSGVYQSSHDLVEAARRRGLAWEAILGMRPGAPGSPRAADGVHEVVLDQRGRDGVEQIRQAMLTSSAVTAADVVITLIPQSDVAMAGVRGTLSAFWVAWVRGAPWPAKGEQSGPQRWAKRIVETRALRSADEVWATTPVLASSFERAVPSVLVPAGVPARERISDGSEDVGTLVWAGRVDVDKRPSLFAELASSIPVTARAFGEGPLLQSMRIQAPHVDWAGWASGSSLWSPDAIFVGTSAREAFGRSAVEAAASGVPIVISDQYGAAPLLVTDPDLRKWCVVESSEPSVWAAKVRRLLTDRPLRKRVSEHVHGNAVKLTIEHSLDVALDRISAVRPKGVK
jgi:glycosyltransferase involved in cell wall biosynthesis